MREQVPRGYNFRPEKNENSAGRPKAYTIPRVLATAVEMRDIEPPAGYARFRNETTFHMTVKPTFIDAVVTMLEANDH